MSLRFGVNFPTPNSGLLILIGRVLTLVTILAFGVAPSCSRKTAHRTGLNTLFPLAVGNRWVFLREGGTLDTTLDSIWIDTDSLRSVPEHGENWYRLCSTRLLTRRIWVCRDSVGDYWFVERDSLIPMPFLLPSKAGGGDWYFRRFCFEVPDTLSIAETTAVLYIPSGDLLLDVWRIQAHAACAKGDWEINLSRGIGPVRWQLQPRWSDTPERWGLLRWYVTDDQEDGTTGGKPYLLGPD